MSASLSQSLRQELRKLSPLDLYGTFYLVVLLFCVLFGHGPRRDHAVVVVSLDLIFCLVLIYAVRIKRAVPTNWFVELVYRLSMLGVTAGTYLQLKYILPAASRAALDAQIYSFDMKVFGVEPSLLWDQYVTPRTTEWFAFFYYSHFFVLTAHAIPFLLFGKNQRRLVHVVMMTLLVFCTGHLLYIAVPGFGPTHHLKDLFVNRLEGGLFWNLVQKAVATNGAQKDIFPSLHTAGPSMFVMFAWVHRKSTPFKYTWAFLGVWTTQIIIATMFLRWHYLVDIVAGLILAATSCYLALRITDWEIARRERLGLPPVFDLQGLPWAAKHTETSQEAA